MHAPAVILPPIAVLLPVAGSVTTYVPLSPSNFEYSAPAIKLCFNEPVLNLPFKKSWSLNVSISVVRVLARRQIPLSFNCPVAELIKLP